MKKKQSEQEPPANNESAQAFQKATQARFIISIGVDLAFSAVKMFFVAFGSEAVFAAVMIICASCEGYFRLFNDDYIMITEKGVSMRCVHGVDKTVVPTFLLFGLIILVRQTVFTFKVYVWIALATLHLVSIALYWKTIQGLCY